MGLSEHQATIQRVHYEAIESRARNGHLLTDGPGFLLLQRDIRRHNGNTARLTTESAPLR